MWWRRRRDSNPRDPSGPTPLAGERLRPLGHVSAVRSTILSNSKTSGKYKKPSLFTICSFLRPQLTCSACNFAVSFIKNSIQTSRRDIRNKSNVWRIVQRDRLLANKITASVALTTYPLCFQSTKNSQCLNSIALKESILHNSGIIWLVTKPPLTFLCPTTQPDKSLFL